MTPKLKADDEDENQQTDEEEEELVDVEDEEEEEATEESGDDEEEVETEEVELPEDEGEDSDEESRGFLSGSTLGVSNKLLLGIGIVAVLVVVVLMNVEPQSSTRSYNDDEQVEEEIEDGSDGAVEQQVTDAGGHATKFSQQAQDDAIGELFG